ncbi:MAG: lysylphosphatidylglycerol synthase transmembrane domain-containing protein [Candidatus Latescibacterota bacterium]|jgi:uncharacterized protein (TIRG00374 family)
MRFGKKTQRRFIFSLILGLFVYVGLAVFGDVRGVAESLRQFNWWMLPAIFGLALGNYAFRLVRWLFYLRLLKIDVSAAQATTVFMSGLAMSISPGKFGELVKSYFLKQMADVPVSRSAPVVFAERFTDFFAIVALAGVGAFAFGHGQRIIGVGLAMTLAVLILVMNRPWMTGLINLLSRVRVLSGLAHTMHELYDHAYTLLRFGPLVLAFFLGVASWFCECSAYYLTIKAMGSVMGIGAAVFIYAFATFFGAVTFLPGGLGATEGSMTGLAILHGVARDAASAATIVIRLATLWFAVVLGLTWIATRQDVLIPDREDIKDRQ